jgi:hypothetical protein
MNMNYIYEQRPYCMHKLALHMDNVVILYACPYVGCYNEQHRPIDQVINCPACSEWMITHRD